MMLSASSLLAVDDTFSGTVVFTDGWAAGDYKDIVQVAPINAGSSGLYQVTISATRGNIAESSTYIAAIDHANADVWREAGAINDNSYLGGARCFTVDVDGAYSAPRFRIRAIRPSSAAGISGSDLAVDFTIRSLGQNAGWTLLSTGGSGATVVGFQSMGSNSYSLYMGNPYRGAGILALSADQFGNVGIGTNAPISRLEVAGGQIAITNNGDNALVSRQGASFYHLIGTYAGWNPNTVYIAGYNVANTSGASQAAAAVSIGGSGVERLWVDLPTGKVGVGTTNPATSLQVASDDIVNGGITIGSGLAADGGNLRLLSSANHWNLDNFSGTLRFFTETGYGTDSAVRMNLSAAGDLAVTGNLSAASLQIAGQSFNPANFIPIGGGNMTGALTTTALIAAGGSVTGGPTGLTLNPGAINKSIVLDHANPDGSAGNGRVEIRDTLAITNTGGIQYLLMGNQDSAGANNPAMLRVANGNLEIGHGDSWTGQGGNFTANVTVSSNGVGIGTGSPASKLSVAGRLDVGSAGFSGSNGTTGIVLNGVAGAAGTASQGLLFGGNGIAHGSLAWMPNERLFILRTGINPTDTTDNWGAANFATNGTIRSAVWQPYGSASDDFYLDVEPGTRMLRTRNWNSNAPNIAATGVHTGTIVAEGSVGIGTLTPAAKLDVAGDARVSGNLTILGTFSAANWSGSGTTTFSGNVGLGTTQPDNKLTLQSSAGGTAYVGWNKSTNSTSFVGLGYDETADVLKISASVGTANFNHDWLAISRTNGNVGIGTLAPGAKLHVEDDTAYTDNELMRLQSGITWGGNVGHISLLNGGVENARIGWYMEDGNDQDGNLRFYTKAPSGTLTERLTIKKSGNVGIGTTAPDNLLTVKGTIHASEVVVDAKVTAKVIRTNDVLVQPKAWADDVFDDGRPLQPLSAVEQSIKEHKHLPGVPSAQEVAANGVSVADMQTVLLQKIEELTLHQIEQEKRLNARDAQNADLAARVAKLEAENAALRKGMQP